ncbi:MAG: hypothetical protein WAL63_13300 [Solirubrobacteraceae bacterium]
MKVHLPKRKSQSQRLVESVTDNLAVPKAVRDSLPHAITDGVRKAGLIAGALAGLTAGSASISVLRRRNEGARDDS